MFHLALLSLLLVVSSVDMSTLPTPPREDVGQGVDAALAAGNAPPIYGVAFMASVQGDQVVRTGATVVYSNVKYNKGNAYSGVSGFFAAPVSGTYCFFFKLEAAPRNEAALSMVKEGSQILYIFGSPKVQNPTASATVVVPLQANERVWVQSARDTTIVRYLYDFGGFLLYQDL